MNTEFVVTKAISSSVPDVVRAALAEALEVDPADFPSSAEEELTALPGVTSLALVRALARIEDELGVDLYEVTYEVRTVSDLCAIVQAKVDGSFNDQVKRPGL
ncbi:acyl carrier protein [Lentzea sp. E54]|uniref:acyl carrier protein n=1 Tax=Lentzea xerophila TaxID=3435883 RepID=UPI003DA32F04